MFRYLPLSGRWLTRWFVIDVRGLFEEKTTWHVDLNTQSFFIVVLLNFLYICVGFWSELWKQLLEQSRLVNELSTVSSQPKLIFKQLLRRINNFEGNYINKISFVNNNYNWFRITHNQEKVSCCASNLRGNRLNLSKFVRRTGCLVIGVNSGWMAVAGGVSPA